MKIAFKRKKEIRRSPLDIREVDKRQKARMDMIKHKDDIEAFLAESQKIRKQMESPWFIISSLACGVAFSCLCYVIAVALVHYIH